MTSSSTTPSPSLPSTAASRSPEAAFKTSAFDHSTPTIRYEEGSKVDTETTETRMRIIYSRKQLLALSKSPFVAPPAGMPPLKSWFGEFEPNHTPSKNKDGEGGSGQRGTRFRQSAENDDSDAAVRATYKSSFAPSQMGNFRHQSMRDRDRGDLTEREKERDLREKENQEKLRSLSDRYDRDRLLSGTGILGASIAPLTGRGKERERESAPHLASQGTRLSAGGRRVAEAREPGKGEKKGRSGDSEDWRRGDPPTRRDERGETSRRHRDSSRGREDEDPPRRQGRGRDQDDEARRWKEDGKPEERDKGRREKDSDAKGDRWSSKDADAKRERDSREGWTVTEEGRHQANPRRRERRGVADEEKERKEREREKEKEKEPAWMDDYTPDSPIGKGIIGGQRKDGQVDGIQAWKLEMKEKERKEREKAEGIVFTESQTDSQRDMETFSSPAANTQVPSAGPVDDLQQLVNMMKANETARQVPTENGSNHALNDVQTKAISRQPSTNILSAINGHSDGHIPSIAYSTDQGRQTPRQNPPIVPANPQPISSYGLTSILAGDHMKSSDSSANQSPLTALHSAQLNGNPDPFTVQTSALPSFSALGSAQRPSSRSQASPRPDLISRIGAGAGQEHQRSVFDQIRSPGTPNGLYERNQPNAFPPPLDNHGSRNRQTSYGSSNDPRASPFSPNDRNHGSFSPVSSTADSSAPVRSSSMMSYDSTGSNASTGAAPASYAPGRGSKFAKFWDGRTKEAAAAGQIQAAANAGIINAPLGGDAGRMQDLLAMLQQSSSQPKPRVPGGPLSPTPPQYGQTNHSPTPQSFASQQQQQQQQQQLQQHQQQMLQHQQQHFGGHNLQDTMFDNNRFVPDGMVPGLRPQQRQRESIREVYGTNDQLDDRLSFNVQRLPQQQQAFDQLHSRPVHPPYNNPAPGGGNRGPGFAGNQSQFRNGASVPPLVSAGAGIPAGLANIGGRPPHDPHRLSNALPLGVNAGMAIDRISGNSPLGVAGAGGYGGRGSMSGASQLPPNLAHLGGRSVELNQSQFMGRLPPGAGLNPGFNDGGLQQFGYGANNSNINNLLNSAAGLNAGRLGPSQQQQLNSLQGGQQFGHNNLDFTVQPQQPHLHGVRGLGGAGGQMGGGSGVHPRNSGGLAGGVGGFGLPPLGPGQLHGPLQQHIPGHGLGHHSQGQQELMALLMGGNLGAAGLGGGFGHRE